MCKYNGYELTNKVWGMGYEVWGMNDELLMINY